MQKDYDHVNVHDKVEVTFINTVSENEYSFMGLVKEVNDDGSITVLRFSDDAEISVNGFVQKISGFYSSPTFGKDATIEVVG